MRTRQSLVMFTVMVLGFSAIVSLPVWTALSACAMLMGLGGFYVKRIRENEGAARQ